MRTTVLISALVAGSLALAACGGSGGADDAAIAALPEPAAGPVPDIPASGASVAESPLPEVAIRRINGDGGWSQFKDLLPAERPTLVWFWAPH